MFRVPGGPPPIHLVQARVASLQVRKPGCRRDRDGLDKAVEQLQALRCPPWNAYPCIELHRDFQRWPAGVSRRPLKPNKNQNFNDPYYVRVQLAPACAKEGQEAIHESAHKLVCWAAHGPPPQYSPTTTVVMHLCDNPRCLSAAHLRNGTKETNQVNNAKHRHAKKQLGNEKEDSWRTLWTDWLPEVE